MIFAKDLEGTGVTVNSLLPGGSCDSDRAQCGRASNCCLSTSSDPLLVWLASPLSDGMTGGRYGGKLWNA